MNKQNWFNFHLIKRHNMEPYWCIHLSTEKELKNFLEIKTNELKQLLKDGIKQHFEENLPFSHQNTFIQNFFNSITAVFPEILEINETNKLLLEQYSKNNLHRFLNGYYTIFKNYGEIYINKNGGCMPCNNIKIMDRKECTYEDFPVNVYELEISKFNPGIHWYAKIGHIYIGKSNSIRETEKLAKEYLQENKFIKVSDGKYRRN